MYTPIPYPDLWSRIRAMFARAIAAIGSPAALAATPLLTRAQWREIAGWIARLESIVRKVLLALAAEIPRERDRAPRIESIPLKGMYVAPKPRRRMIARRTELLDLAQPHTWRARFCFGVPAAPRIIPAHRVFHIRDPSAPPPRVTPRCRSIMQRFALRLEALRRVLDDPAPYVLKLAQAIRNACRQNLDAARAMSVASVRGYTPDQEDPRLNLDVMARAMDGVPMLSDSS